MPPSRTSRHWREREAARRPRRDGWLLFYIAGACLSTSAAVLGFAFYGLSGWQAAGLYVGGVSLFALVTADFRARGEQRRLRRLAEEGRGGLALSLARRQGTPACLLADLREAACGPAPEPEPVLPRPPIETTLLTVPAAAVSLVVLHFPLARSLFLAAAAFGAGIVLSTTVLAVRLRRTARRLLTAKREDAAHRFAERAQITYLMDFGLQRLFARRGGRPYQPPLSRLPAWWLPPWLFVGAAAWVALKDLPALAGVVLCAAAWYGTSFVQGARVRAEIRAELDSLADRHRARAARTAARLAARHRAFDDLDQA